MLAKLYIRSFNLFFPFELIFYVIFCLQLSYVNYKCGLLSLINFPNYYLICLVVIRQRQRLHAVF